MSLLNATCGMKFNYKGIDKNTPEFENNIILLKIRKSKSVGCLLLWGKHTPIPQKQENIQYLCVCLLQQN